MAEATLLQQALAVRVAALQIFLLQQAQVHPGKAMLEAILELVDLVLEVAPVLLVVQQLVVLEYYGLIQIVIMVVEEAHQVIRLDLLLEVLGAVEQVLNILDVFLPQQVLQALVVEVGLEVT